MTGLAGKVIAITGGAGDIGRATGCRLAGEGSRVYLLDIVGEVEGERARVETGAAGYFDCSQTDRAAIDRTLELISKTEHRLDCIIINAGKTSAAGIAEMDMREWREIVELNLNGSVESAQSALRIMLQQSLDAAGVRGRILFTGSQCQRRLEHGGVAYQVTKRALERFTEQLAYDYAAERVLSNMLVPGILMAGLTKKIIEARPAVRDMLLERIPLGEFGTAEQTAAAFAFLCSDESTYMTGTCLTIDGGCVLGRAERTKAVSEH
jgi:glucose 1-dehydrogenase